MGEQSSRDVLPARPRARSFGVSSITLGIAVTVLFGAGTGALVARSDEASPAPAAGSPAMTFALPERVPPTEPSAPREPDRSSRAAPRRATPPREACGAPGARLIRFRVLVEDGVPTSETAFARAVADVLCDRRSWIGSGRVRFRYDPRARALISLRTPDSTQSRCLALTGLSVNRKYSCASAGAREAVLNAARWFEGSPTWDGTVAAYRAMLVNHEVGHLLGQRHRSCSRDGAPAPVMMQQSKGLGGCEPNPWPLRYELRSIRRR